MKRSQVASRPVVGLGTTRTHSGFPNKSVCRMLTPPSVLQPQPRWITPALGGRLRLCSSPSSSSSCRPPDSPAGPSRLALVRVGCRTRRLHREWGAVLYGFLRRGAGGAPGEPPVPSHPLLPPPFPPTCCAISGSDPQRDSELCRGLFVGLNVFFSPHSCCVRRTPLAKQAPTSVVEMAAGRTSISPPRSGWKWEGLRKTQTGRLLPPTGMQLV